MRAIPCRSSPATARTPPAGSTKSRSARSSRGWSNMRLLAERKQTILRSIESQGKLTAELAAEIEAADSTKRLEDLYLPYKPKKQTLATRGPRARAGAAGRRSALAGTLRRSRRPRGRLRQSRPRRDQRRRRTVGRGPHPGRTVQRAGRPAAEAAPDPQPHRQARQRRGPKPTKSWRRAFATISSSARCSQRDAAASRAGDQPRRAGQGAARQDRSRPGRHASGGRRDRFRRRTIRTPNSCAAAAATPCSG